MDNIIFMPREFLSTLSLRRATHYDNYNLHCVEISIHALLAESDRLWTILYSCPGNFYPRSPCGERRLGLLGWLRTLISIHALLAESDKRVVSRNTLHELFLSTLSLRRATIISPHSTPDNSNFYPRSPCGERPVCAVAQSPASQFLSTLSLRRATGNCPSGCQRPCISIHALLAESDQQHLPDSTHRQISIHALLAESDK